MGNQNCHAEITFKDSVKWLARFRVARTSSPPREVRDWILRSEAATMTYLQRYTCIPTPKIFDWACESDPENPLGVGYILMEKLDAKPLDWQAATRQQKEKVMQQLVDIFLEIERHPFEAMGSLMSSAGDINIQGLAHQSTFPVGKGPLGPFSSSLEGCQVMLESYLAMIASGEIDPCSPVDTYLVHRFRQDIVGALFKDAPSGDRFFLKHPDDKGDHILVNDCFDIVGIIDWEWTQTVSKAEAFCSPCMMWPVAEFYNGFNELCEDELRLANIFREKGREDLAMCVVEGRKAQKDNLEDERPNPGESVMPCIPDQSSNPVKRGRHGRRQSGGDGESCPHIPGDYGPGRNVNWEEGPSGPECTSDDNCGGELCTGYYCDPNPEIRHPPDYYDPKDPENPHGQPPAPSPEPTSTTTTNPPTHTPEPPTLDLCIGSSVTPTGQFLVYAYSAYMPGAHRYGVFIVDGNIGSSPDICEAPNSKFAIDQCGTDMTFVNEGPEFFSKCGFQLDIRARSIPAAAGPSG
ncbi:hypothetical protein N7524_008656 [Penicillium chrysogenum]|nr:hypothetical protein N7524_008656 [Penicillium chrysogenum]